MDMNHQREDIEGKYLHYTLNVLVDNSIAQTKRASMARHGLGMTELMRRDASDTNCQDVCRSSSSRQSGGRTIIGEGVLAVEGQA